MFDRRNYVYDLMFDWTILSVSQPYLYVTPSTTKARSNYPADKLSVQQIQQQQIALMQQQQAVVPPPAAQAAYYPYQAPQMPLTSAQQQVHEHMQTAGKDQPGQIYYSHMPNVQGGGLISNQPQMGEGVEALAADMSKMAIKDKHAE
jgi:hypothetical protein